jgi:hypothetical protein
MYIHYLKGQCLHILVPDLRKYAQKQGPKLRDHKWLTNLCANSMMIEMAAFGMDESVIRNNNKCVLVFMFDSYILRCI